MWCRLQSAVSIFTFVPLVQLWTQWKKSSDVLVLLWQTFDHVYPLKVSFMAEGSRPHCKTLFKIIVKNSWDYARIFAPWGQGSLFCSFMCCKYSEWSGAHDVNIKVLSMALKKEMLKSWILIPLLSQTSSSLIRLGADWFCDFVF